MKNLLKENSPPPDAMDLAELHTGCVVGFGFMPQKSVSGKRVPVAEVNSYLFDAGNFISYRLVNDSVDVNLIIADEEDPAGTYLAISQRVESRLFEAFFGATPPSKWFRMKEGDTLMAKPPVLGPSQGWLTSRYTVTVVTLGRYLEGDWRMRKPTDRGRLSRSFDYVLLVDEDNEYALEAERYEDGTLNIFATIYRPATDIGEITRPPKLVTYGSVESIPHVAISAVAAVEKKEPPAEVLKLTETPKVEPEVLKIPEPAEALKIPEPPKEPEVAKAPEPGPVAVVTPPKPTLQEALEPVLAQKKTGTSLAEAFKTALAETPADELTAPVAKTEAVSVPEPTPVQLHHVVEAEPVADVDKQPLVAEPLAIVAATPAVTETAAPEQSKVELSIVSSEAGSSTMPVQNKFGRIYAVGSQEQGLSPADTLACSLPLAARLIDEAQRNKMLLSEMVRKVIDLPARVQDQVWIPFALDNAELAELARRYNLPATDVEGVKRQIVEELKSFVGQKE